MNSYQTRGPGGPLGRSQYHQRHQYEHRFPEHSSTRPHCTSPPHGQYRQSTPPRGSHNNHQRDYYCTSRRRRSKSAERIHPESHRPRTSPFGENVRASERRGYTRSSPVRRSRSRHADRTRPPAVPYGRGRSRSRSRSPRPCSPKQVVPGGGCIPFPQEFRPEPKKYSPPPKCPLFVPVHELPFEPAPLRFPPPQVQYREIPEERDIERRILDPTQIRVVRREGEGTRPLFDRQEILAAPVDLREDCLRRVVAVVRPRWAPPSPPPPARQSRTVPGSPPFCRGRSPSFEPGGARCERFEEQEGHGRYRPSDHAEPRYGNGSRRPDYWPDTHRRSLKTIAAQDPWRGEWRENGRGKSPPPPRARRSPARWEHDMYHT
ncbi:unnamed protein product [Ixodes hexagonus]